MGATKHWQIDLIDVEEILRVAKKELGDDLGGMSEVDLIADQRTGWSLEKIRTLLKEVRE